MNRRWLAGIGLACAGALGCGLIVSPAKGIEDISALVLAAPSVVLGDILRDSLGNPAPLLVNAYDGAGNLVTGITTQYFVLDTIPTVSIDPATGLLHGLTYDTLGAHVIAQVGNLQTPVQMVFVSVHPDAVTVQGSVGPLQFNITTPDTLAVANWSDTLALNVHNLNGIGAQGFIVEYSILQSPTPLSAGLATAYIGDDQGVHAARDTTDLHGEAHRRVVLNQFNIGDEGLLRGTKTDTIIVQASVRYGGAPVPGSPLIFLIPVVLQ